jgi:fumarate reductase subunit D
MNDLQNQELSQRVQRRMRRRKVGGRWGALAVHTVISMIALGVLLPILNDPKLASLALPFDPQAALGVLIILLIFSLAVHLASVVIDSGLTDEKMASEALAQELGKQFIEDQLARLGEKPKRESAHLESDYVRINEEGELVPDEDARKSSAER